jgi:hypothetical protein
VCRCFVAHVREKAISKEIQFGLLPFIMVLADDSKMKNALALYMEKWVAVTDDKPNVYRVDSMRRMHRGLVVACVI